MRKLLMGAVLAVALAAAGPPLQAQQLDRLTIERAAQPAPSAVALEHQGVLVNTSYRVSHDALPLRLADKAAGKKKKEGESATDDKRSQRASAEPAYHPRL